MVDRKDARLVVSTRLHARIALPLGRARSRSHDAKDSQPTVARGGRNRRAPVDGGRAGHSWSRWAWSCTRSADVVNTFGKSVDHDRVGVRVARREWLKLAFGAAGGVLLFRGGVGCGYYTAESGDAYAPWDFPGTENVPERIAARAAILASNPHNSQPWALQVTASRIDLHADFTRSLGTIDSLLREMHIGLGCALENMVIAARSNGRAADVQLVPDPSNPSLVSTVSLMPIALAQDPLFGAIAGRHTNRGRYADAPASAALRPALQALVTESGVELLVLTSESDKANFRASTIDATNAFIADAEMSRDSNAWYRQSAADILQHRDGITLDASGNGASTRFFGKASGRPSDATANAYWLDGTSGDQTTGSAFCILSSPVRNGRDDQLRVGRAYQRIHLWAVSQGLAAQPLNQLAEMQDREETKNLPPRFTTVLSRMLSNQGRRAQMLFRIGYPWDRALESPRRPLEWVIV